MILIEVLEKLFCKLLYWIGRFSHCGNHSKSFKLQEASAGDLNYRGHSACAEKKRANCGTAVGQGEVVTAQLSFCK